MDRKEKNFKALTVLKTVLSVCVIVLGILSLTDVWDSALDVITLLLGVVLLIQAVEFWKNHRAYAIFTLLVTAFLFAVCIAEWFIFI